MGIFPTTIVLEMASSTTANSLDLDKKVDVEHAEHSYATSEPSQPNAGSCNTKGKDEALEILGDSSKPIHISPEQDRAILRKIDLWLMPVIVMVYFLQQLDKCVLTPPSQCHPLTNMHQVFVIVYLSIQYPSGHQY